MRDFRELTVWQKAHQLALDVYRTTSRFPQTEVYGLTSQIRRAGVSIAANIVEYGQLSGEAQSVRRMLTTFVRRLKANG